VSTFNQYQEAAAITAIYPSGTMLDDEQRERILRLCGLMYLALGANGEAGEIADKVKKAVRDGFADFDELRESLGKEIGDLLWYAAMLARELGLPFDNVALANIEKLRSRQARGALRGSGDDR